MLASIGLYICWTCFSNDLSVSRTNAGLVLQGIIQQGLFWFSALWRAAVCQHISPMSPFRTQVQGNYCWQAIVSWIHSSFYRAASSEGCHPRSGLLLALPQSPAIMVDPLKRPSRKLRESGCDRFSSSLQHVKGVTWRTKKSFSQTDSGNQRQEKISLRGTPWDEWKQKNSDLFQVVCTKKADSSPLALSSVKATHLTS